MSQGSPDRPVGATAADDRLTTVFRLLSRPRRRRALYVLRERDGAVSVERLVELVREGDAGDGPAAPFGEQAGGDDRPPDAGDGAAGTGDRTLDARRGTAADGRCAHVATALRHVHLPKLVAAGAVERVSDGAVRYAAGDVLDDWVASAAAAEGP